MKIPSRFTIAVHILIAVEYFKKDYKVTSEFLASSVGVNPVIIRGILGQLKKADLIEVQAGSGGAKLLKKPNEITLKDIFYAVDSLDKDKLFGFHENPNLKCPVGSKIHFVLDGKLDRVQEQMDKELSKTTLSALLKGVKEWLNLMIIKIW